MADKQDPGVTYEPPEAGETFEGYDAPKEVVDESDEVTEEEVTDANDGTPDEPAEDGDQSSTPQTSETEYVQRIDTLTAKNQELESKIDTIMQMVSRQQQPQKQEPAKAEIAKWRKMLQDPNLQPDAAKRLEGILEAFESDLAPQLQELKQFKDWQERQTASSAAREEERDAEQYLRTTYEATDAEIAAAKQFAREAYREFADGKRQAWPGGYEDLFERAIARGRHSAVKQAKAQDKEAGNLRAEAQRRADPTKGSKPPAKTPPGIPDDVKNMDFRSQMRWLEKQGMVVRD